MISFSLKPHIPLPVSALISHGVPHCVLNSFLSSSLIFLFSGSDTSNLRISCPSLFNSSTIGSVFLHHPHPTE